MIFFIMLFSQFQVVVLPGNHIKAPPAASIICASCFFRSEVISPTQWAERAEQHVGERDESHPDDAQVGRCSVHLA